MQTAQQQSIIAALDIGTNKITVAVGEADGQDALSVLGFGKVSAYGVHAGSVQDVEMLVDSIRKAVDEAEQMAGCRITSVTAALTGKHLHSINKVGRLVLPEGEVDNNAVKRATRLAMTFDAKTDAKSEDDRLVSHVIKGYTIDNDDDNLLEDPVGMAGNVLQAHAHLAVGSDSVVLNLVKCIRRAGLDVEGLVLQPWASAAGTLTPTERELGVIMLDIGAGAVDVACYENGRISYTAVVPYGGDLITRDIASGLNCSIAAADEIKLTYGHIGVRREDAYETIRYTFEPTGEEKTVTNERVIEIITARCEEMLIAIGKHWLAQDRWFEKAAAGIVMTGGVTNLPGFLELAQSIYHLPVRQGLPAAQKGAALSLAAPEDSTVIGVLLETLRRRRLSGTELRRHGRWDAFTGALKRIVFGDFSG